MFNIQTKEEKEGEERDAVVVVKPGAFKTLEEARRAYPELIPIVEATPTCIVYSSGRIDCWGRNFY